ncbi:MAG: Magnesium and cobalt efflux protein CorC [Firmicutes bacterium ADurb.Bin300]|nr:MAG: Magnesium and cobalt efflux protein CorC [Firmicutes bacterium ADurb.Bin300]
MDDPGPSSLLSLAVNALQSGLINKNALLIQVPLLLFLIIVNAFFAMSEIAIISLNDNKIERMAEEGHKKAKLVMRLTQNSSRFLSTIQIGVTLAGFLTSASAATSFADALSTSISQRLTSVPQGFIHGACVVLITVIISYFSLVLGELAPKRIAMQIPERISFAVAPVLLFTAKITKPLVKLLSLSTNAVVRLFGLDPNASVENVTEEEIKMMVDVGEEKGVIEFVQREMINNVFEFNDLDAGDIMTHRTDMVAVDADDTSFEEFVRLAIDTGFSRIPIYDEDPDNIIGVIYVKDLLGYVGKQLPGKNTLKSIMRDAYYIPETKPCGEIFAEMSTKRIQMAIVVDEYGGTAGILTLEDLVEAIMGNILDEYDNEDDEISQIDEYTFTIDGTADLDEVNELIGAELPEGEYDTLGGYIISRLRYLPKDGEMNTVKYKNVTFTVLNVDERRIGKVRVEVSPLIKEEKNVENE